MPSLLLHVLRDRAEEFEEGGQTETLHGAAEGGQQEATAAKRQGTPPDMQDLNDRASDQQIESMEEQLNSILANKGGGQEAAAHGPGNDSTTAIEQPSQE